MMLSTGCKHYLWYWAGSCCSMLMSTDGSQGIGPDDQGWAAAQLFNACLT